MNGPPLQTATEIELPSESRALTIPDLVAQRAARSPERIAWRHRGPEGAWQEVTWAGFQDAILATAAGLQRLGLGAGDRLAIMMPTGYRWELLEKAALRLGAAVVGVDSHAGAEQKQHVVGHSRAKILFSSSAGDVAALDGAALPSLQRLVLTDGEASAGGDFDLRHWAAFEGLCGEGGDLGPGPGPDSPAAITYTSGTTGPPKGILYSHRQMLLACESLLEAFGPIGESDSAICWLPLSNLFQRVMNLCGIGAGATCAFVEDPRRIVEEIAEIEPTVFIGVPRFYEKLRHGVLAKVSALPRRQRWPLQAALAAGRETARRRRLGLKPGPLLGPWHGLLRRLVLRRLPPIMGRRLRFMITGSAPTPSAVLDFYDSLELPLLEAYGLSEDIVPVAANRPQDRRPGTVGRPLAPNDVRIGEDGEVLVRGPGLFAGYLDGGDPEGGEAAPSRDGFYPTGDLGRFDDDGYLRLTGRRREIIKTSTGRRIAPQAVEAALQDIPGIEHALVVGNGRKALAALIAPVTPDATSAFEARLRQGLARHNERCTGHERIAACLLLSEPFTVADGHLTPSLKLRRAWLEQRFAEAIDRLYERLDGDGRDAAEAAGAPLLMGPVR